VNVCDFWLEGASSVLNCKIGRTPYNYFGLSIGGNPIRLSFWKPVIDCIKSRLSIWNCRNLWGVVRFFSKLLCPRFRLFSLLLQGSHRYYLYCRIFLYFFLYGGDGESRKVHLIHWDKVCLDRRRGGLGVRRGLGSQ
jgi:hypothetical protein